MGRAGGGNRCGVAKEVAEPSTGALDVALATRAVLRWRDGPSRVLVLARLGGAVERFAVGLCGGAVDDHAPACSVMAASDSMRGLMAAR